MDLNELPDEMLCTIFDHLDVYELKLASLVCRRWSELTFSDRRMDRVWLVKRDCNCEFLFNTKRNYRNVHQPWVKDGQIDSLVRLLHTIKPHVRVVEIESIISSQLLRQVLLEASELQRLSIGYINNQIYGGTRAPLRVLPELKRPNRRQLFSFFRTNIPNLQFLKMDCQTDVELNVWKILSGQLKLACVELMHGKYLHSVLELTFPLVEDFTLASMQWHFHTRRQRTLRCFARLGGAFFRRHPFLRRLSISGMITPVEWVESITRHCPEVTHLKLVLDNPEEGLLKSLVQLSKLKHLSLEADVHRKILCGVIASLESVELKMHHSRVFLQNLFEVVPRLSCLRITYRISCDDLQFICDKFSCLRRLELYFYDEVSIVADDSVRFDRLEHLQELKVSHNIRIRSIHRNNVRCITITNKFAVLDPRLGIMNSDLDWIPHKFPLLNRLILEKCSVSLAAVEQLQKLIPSCRIDYDNKRFYPIIDAPAK